MNQTCPERAVIAASLLAAFLMGCVDREAMVRQRLQQARVAPSTSKRAAYEHLFLYVSRPTTTSDDALAMFSFREAASDFVESKDEAILNAFDTVPLDGGIGTMLCTNYESLLIQSPVARAHYRASPKRLSRCVGVSFSESELRGLLEVP